MSKIPFQKALISVAFALLLATPIATALSRNAAFPLLIVVALLLVVTVALQSEGTKKLVNVARWIFCFRLDAPAAYIALAMLLFVLVSLLWSTAPARGFGAVAGASTAALVSVFCCVLVARHVEAPTWLRWGLPAAIAAGCLIIISEVTFGGPLRAALGASIHSSRLNRAAVAIALMLPLLFLRKGGRSNPVLYAAVFAVALAALFISDSEAAKLAAVVIVAMLPIVLALKARHLIIVGSIVVIAMHALAPLLLTALYNLFPRDFIEANAPILVQHFIRLEIWWAYAQQVFTAPVFGHGLQASYDAINAYPGSDEAIERGLAFIHPHNFSIQVWYELGLVGTILSSGLILFFMRYLLRGSDNQQRVSVLIIAAVWGIASVSHGAWQHWWWAMTGIVAMLFAALSRPKHAIDGDEASS